MNREERERLVDSVLDRALGPQGVEPRSGLEERILANLPKEREPRPWWRWMLVPALAAAAVLAVAIGMRVMHRGTPVPVQANRTTEQPKQEVVVKPQAPVQQPLVPPRQMAKRVVPKATETTPKVEVASAKVGQQLPRQAVFPSPAPLTEQERLLLALVNQQRPQAEQIAAEQQAYRESFQKYLETGEAPVPQPAAAQPMR